MSNRSELDKGEKGGRKNKVAKSKSSRNEVNECTENSGPVVVVTDESDPPNVSAINKTLPGRSCKSCRGPDAGGMVQCDECSKWHHFTCVGVTEDVENHSWSCPKCVSCQMGPARKLYIEQTPPTKRCESTGTRPGSKS
nr:inhibitor of growth protein 1-like [Aedes albopictus]